MKCFIAQSKLHADLSDHTTRVVLVVISVEDCDLGGGVLLIYAVCYTYPIYM